MTKSRNFQEGRTYHVTHRCHGREYLLGKDVDRRRYMNLLWRAHGGWDVSILGELSGSRSRYRLIDTALLLKKLGQGDRGEFVPWYMRTLDALCSRRENLVREPFWSEARIVGDRRFVSSMVESRKQEDIVIYDDEISFIS